MKNGYLLALLGDTYYARREKRKKIKTFLNVTEK
jgi:hypothetical protein